MINNQPIPGMTERYGVDLEKWNYITSKMINTAKILGYNQLEVPILEWENSFSEEVIGRSPWPEWNKRGMFYLNIDNYQNSYSENNTDLTKALLIPEGTISVTRWLGKHIDNNKNIELPIKLMYVLSCFRNELMDSLSDTKKRQFSQFGIEILGSSEIFFDVENIYMPIKILQNLGVYKRDIRIRANDINIFNQLILECGVSEEDTIIFKESLDSIAECKAGKGTERLETEIDSVLSRLDKYDLQETQLKKWISIINHSSGTITNDFYDLFGYDYHYGFDNLNRLQKSFKDFDMNIVIDLCVIRSHEYYTGISFEVDVLSQEKKYIEIAGGGRYDKLVKNFVKSTDIEVVPSTGFAFGLERVVDMIDELDLFPQESEITSKYYFSNDIKDIHVPKNDINQYLNAVENLFNNKSNEKTRVIAYNK